MFMLLSYTTMIHYDRRQEQKSAHAITIGEVTAVKTCFSRAAIPMIMDDYDDDDDDDGYLKSNP